MKDDTRSWTSIVGVLRSSGSLLLLIGGVRVMHGVKSALDSCLRAKSRPDNDIRGFIAVTGDGE